MTECRPKRSLNADGVRLEPKHEAAHGGLIEATRRLQDAVMASNAPARVLDEMAQSIADAADELMNFPADWPNQVAGQQFHLPGRGQVLTPRVYIDELSQHKIDARWTFTSFYDGGGGVVLGGAVMLVLDELCGRLANYVSGELARTAFLRVDFRTVTRIGAELTFQASVDRLEGRKLFIAGSLHDSESLLCDVQGLFIRIRPGGA
jgi:acyl-coenzyme A thioesterase PaaI-like protein